MDRDTVFPRHRRPPRRRPRPGARTLSDRRWTWLALGALLLLAPALLRGQGLRSTVASVSLVAVKPDADPGAVVDLMVPVTSGHATERVSVRLEDPGAPPIYVRSLSGRLERLGTAALPVTPGPLALRTVGAAPGTRWRLVVQRVGPDGQVREERLEVGPAQR